MADKIHYLNAGRFGDVLYSRLVLTLNELKQPRAVPAQWIGTIRSFIKKGVKQAEIDDVGVVDHLESLAADVKVEKESLLQFIRTRQPLIKRVDLDKPKYSGYVSLKGDYTERLYILSSEAMRADDEVEDLFFQIEELGFNPAPLLEDPTLVDRLEARMDVIRSNRPQMFDFKAHHHSNIIEKHGKNLMAHSRFVFKDGLFFIQEIQSDWAQKGRLNNWSLNFPKAPFVTNTEQWVGVVLRDLMSEAALNLDCRQVAWIRASMRNGWTNSNSGDDLAVFYDDIVRRMVEKTLGKTGSPGLMQINTSSGAAEVLGFEMTPQVRKHLSASLPLYSRDAVLADIGEDADPWRTQERKAVLRECKTMLGDPRTIRFVSRLYDISQGIEVAGKYLHAGIGACIPASISLSMRAKHLERSARHEMWHFAHENFLYAHEQRMMRLEFSPGTPLNERTVQTLQELGLHDAAAQCADHRECAAHAFSLWYEGRLDVDEAPRSIFWGALKAVEKVSDWLSEKIFNVTIHRPVDLFEAMKSGALQYRQKMNQAIDQSYSLKEMEGESNSVNM